VVLVRTRYQNGSHRQPPPPWTCPRASDTLHFHLCCRRCLEPSRMPGAALSGGVQHQAAASVRQDSGNELPLQSSRTAHATRSLRSRHTYADRTRLLTKRSCTGSSNKRTAPESLAVVVQRGRESSRTRRPSFSSEFPACSPRLLQEPSSLFLPVSCVQAVTEVSTHRARECLLFKGMQMHCVSPQHM